MQLNSIEQAHIKLLHEQHAEATKFYVDIVRGQNQRILKLARSHSRISIIYVVLFLIMAAQLTFAQYGEFREKQWAAQNECHLSPIRGIPDESSYDFFWYCSWDQGLYKYDRFWMEARRKHQLKGADDE